MQFIMLYSSQDQDNFGGYVSRTEGLELTEMVGIADRGRRKKGDALC